MNDAIDVSDEHERRCDRQRWRVLPHRCHQRGTESEHEAADSQRLGHRVPPCSLVHLSYKGTLIAGSLSPLIPKWPILSPVSREPRCTEQIDELERSCRCSRFTCSKNLLDRVNGPVRTNFSYADGQQTIEERVLRCSALKKRHGAKVVVRVVPHASECHVDQGTVISLKRGAQVELERSVGFCRDPV